MNATVEVDFRAPVLSVVTLLNLRTSLCGRTGWEGVTRGLAGDPSQSSRVCAKTPPGSQESHVLAQLGHFLLRFSAEDGAQKSLRQWRVSLWCHCGLCFIPRPLCLLRISQV